MKAAGGKRHGPLGWGVSLVVIGAAAYAAWLMHLRAEARPTSEDAALDAEVVHMAALVGGRIVELPVTENAKVAKGDLLFRLDPVPYQLLVEAAEAELDVARAALATQQRIVATQRSAAAVAAEQTRRAQTNLDLASRTTGRLRPLGSQGYVAQQQVDQAETAQRDAETSLRQARVQQSAAQQAVDTTEGAAALVRAREVALAQARRALSNAEVRAPAAGRVVGLKIAEGEVVAPSQAIFTLINTEAWYAEANFREGELAQIPIGACATVYSLIDRTQPIRGTVQGIGWGVMDEDSITLPRNLPYVSRTLDWVRIAQRFPVRVKLEEPPETLTRMGASATVQIRHGAACE